MENPPVDKRLTPRRVCHNARSPPTDRDGDGHAMFGKTVELLLNTSSDGAAREGAIVSGRKPGPHASETRLVARAIVLNARHKRASGVLSPYAKVRHLPCALSWWGRVFANTRTRGMLCWAGLDLMSK